MQIIIGIIAFIGVACVYYLRKDLGEKTKRGIGFFDSYDDDNWQA